MKSFLAFPLIFLIFFSGIGMRYSAHLCQGNVVATKFSLRNDVATCGMEKSNSEKSGLTLVESRCCDNLIADFLLKTNYLASSAYNVEIIGCSNNIIFSPFCLPDMESFIIKPSINKSAPPGGEYSNIISRPEFRILRI